MPVSKMNSCRLWDGVVGWNRKGGELEGTHMQQVTEEQIDPPGDQWKMSPGGTWTGSRG